MQNTELEKSIHNIYDIGIKVKELYNIIEENEGEIDDEQYSLLQFEKSEIKKIGCDLIGLTNIINSQANMISIEITRLSELKAKKDKQILNIEKALMWVLLNFGEQDKKGIWRLDLDIVNLTTRKNPQTVVIEDENLVPNDYKNYEIQIKQITNKGLELVKDLLKFFPNQEHIFINNKVSKTRLKPKLEELKNNTEHLLNLKKLTEEKNESELLEGNFEESIQLIKQQLESLPNYGAYIKEGDLKLVIK